MSTYHTGHKAPGTGDGAYIVDKLRQAIRVERHPDGFGLLAITVSKNEKDPSKDIYLTIGRNEAVRWAVALLKLTTDI